MTNITVTNYVQFMEFLTFVEGGLDENDYGYESSIIMSPEDSVQCYGLWFNRNIGVKDGETYTFTVKCKLGPLKFKIFVSLKGTSLNSDFYITVSAHDEYGQHTTTGEITDKGTFVIEGYIDVITDSRFYYNIIIKRFLNGAYDDVTIDILPSKQLSTE